MKSIKTKRLVLSAMLLCMGLVLPFLTGQIKEIGDSLLPMHIPVMLCGLLCGAGYGSAVGLMMPFVRSLFFGMPPIYPNAVWMALELATYGFVIGILYFRAKTKSLAVLYVSLISAMLAGRVVWGISKALLLGLGGKAFTVGMFVSGGFIDSLPGMILQLILIPFIVKMIEKRNT
jgi:riboflavin transporter FmnP